MNDSKHAVVRFQTNYSLNRRYTEHATKPVKKMKRIERTFQFFTMAFLERFIRASTELCQLSTFVRFSEAFSGAHSNVQWIDGFA